MAEIIVRMFFSFLAAAVTLAMSAEWATWAFSERQYWKLLPAVILAAFAVFEAHQVWIKADALIERI